MLALTFFMFLHQ